MIKINFKGEEQFTFGLKELEKELDFNLADEGMELISYKQEIKGYNIIKTENSYKILYHSFSDFYAAFFLLLKDFNCENNNIKRQKFCNDLGFMLDCSRNAVFNIKSIKKLIRVLALLGYNYLELYTEDTYEIEGEKYFGYKRGKYTALEIKEIDDYTKKFGIELIPCIQTLAHLKEIFRWKRFKEINDTNDILLIREPKTYELIEKMIKTLRENFTSERINIGMDEAHMVGLGKFLDVNGYSNRTEIMLEHLKKVMDICKKYNFRPAMWNDMFFRLLGKGYRNKGVVFSKKVVKMVPDGIQLIYWDYSTVDVELYTEMIDSSRQLSKNTSFASGAFKWIGFAPNNRHSANFIKPAITACREKCISDVLLTAWGDNGAECSPFTILPSMILFSELCYNEKALPEELNSKSNFLTGYTYDEFISLDLPNVLYEDNTNLWNICKCYLYNDLLLGLYDKHIKEDSSKRYYEIEKKLTLLAERNSSYSYLFKNLAALSRVLKNKSDLGILIRKDYAENDIKSLKTKAELIEVVINDINSFYDAFKNQWYTENKTYGFEIQDMRLGGLIQRLKNVKDTLLKFCNGEIKEIAELNEECLPLSDNPLTDNINYNNWAETISANII